MDIILVFWIIWMARKLFLSIIQATTKIFRAQSQRKNILNQLFVFISEFLIIFVIAAVIIFSFIMNKLVSSNALDPIREFLPGIVNFHSHLIVSIFLYFVIFICTVLVYRVSSGTKPPLLYCISYAALNVLTFFLISFLINKFVNFGRYNIVYGTISTLVILMMRVYFFFVFFWFYAQMIYVSQFFDTLLLSEVYLLPSNEAKGLAATIRRMMFINPQALKTTDNTRFYRAGSIIFKKGDSADYIYYVRKGEMAEETDGKQILHPQGSFVGEVQCILNHPQIGNGVAISDCKLLIFTKEEFMDLMQKTPKAATKTISRISEETAKINYPQD